MLLRHFGLPEEPFRAPRDSRCLSHKAKHHQAFVSQPGGSPTGARANADEPITLKPVRNTVPFAVIVKPSKSLGSLAMQYLGDFDRDRTRQVRECNPERAVRGLLR
jgi:hypothetical protein